MLKTRELDGKYLLEIVTETNRVVGIFVLDIDGFYYYEPEDGRGYFTSNSLREIADLLDEQNRPYNEQLDKYFKNGDKN